MAWNKDIRYTEKKVDESWKEQAEKSKPKETASSNIPAASTQESKLHTPPPESSPAFLQFLNSLAYQIMFHLGELQASEPSGEINLEAAKEIIDILNVLKDKTRGNLSPEEAQFFKSVLPELQMKFVQLS